MTRLIRLSALAYVVLFCIAVLFWSPSFYL